jgi:hypothetical protein
VKNPWKRESLVVVAGHADEEAALADLAEVELAFKVERLRLGRAAVVSFHDGHVRLTRKVRGPRSRVGTAALLTFWIWEPIWLWLSLASALGLRGRRRRRTVAAELRAILDQTRQTPFALVLGIPAQRREAILPALDRASSQTEWTLPVPWEDIVGQLGLGWVEQRRLRLLAARSRKATA